MEPRVMCRGSDELSYCFVFVCQAGPLEVQAMLLAASLARFLKCRHELVAAVPVPEGLWGAPRQKTLDQLACMGVRIQPVRNDVAPGYAIGNKIGALGIRTGCDKTVLLDSDMICLREFRHEARFHYPFSAKPVDRLYFGRQESDWDPVYRAVGLSPPRTRVRSTVFGEASLPYFNAGVVAGSDGYHFAREWRECCLRIDRQPDVHPKRPWLDQLGLAAAVARLSLDVDLLGERYNFPANFKRIDDGNPPIFCHYHRAENLLPSRRARFVLSELLRRHPYVLRAMRAERTFRPVVSLFDPGLRRRIPVVTPLLDACRSAAYDLDDRRFRQRTPTEQKRRNVIVTGLPRSGTSLFSSLLNRIDNVVCLNEVSPTERCHRFFGRMRRRIEAGKPVWNRFDGNGMLTTNTVKDGVRTEARVAEIIDGRFVLAHKYTLPYLNRLERLCDEGWPIWVVVRDPRYAIQSWRSCPPHFGIAEILPVGPLLAHIPFTSDDRDLRRVEVWNHYARRIHACRDRLHIVRYEDLVANPRREMGRFCEAFGLAPPEDLGPSLDSRNRPGAYALGSGDIEKLVERRCDLGLLGYA